MLNLKYQNQPVAAELFGAAWCNLDCRYCYIPKHNDLIKKKHAQIIEQIKTIDPIIDKLYFFYGDRLECLSHWGSEPTLTIKHFKGFYIKALQVFPKLSAITMSSNFLSKVDDLLDFIKTFPTERKITFNIQVSIDGPPWITDVNRNGEGLTQKIIDNHCYFVREVNNMDIPHTVKQHWKPTIARDQYARLLENDNIREYYQFFQGITDEIRIANSKNKVQMAFVCDPTIVCPDEYTITDGIRFNTIYEKTQEISGNYTIPVGRSYYDAFRRLVIFGDEFFTKHKMFTCSAGDSQFGIDDQIQPCHDTFYLNLPKYEDALSNDSDRICSKQEKANVKSGNYHVARDVLLLPHDASDHDHLMYRYRFRGFHDFAQNKLSIAVGVIREMAHCGQVSAVYKNDEAAKALAIFTLGRHSCPTGNVQYSGFLSAMPMAYYKLFGNGLVENFIKRLGNES